MYTLKQVETWFSKAMDRPKERRKGFLEEKLAHDPRLLTSVLNLIEVEEADKSAMTILVDQMNLDLESEEVPVLERYHVIEEIGRGGMSVVYRGERTDGLFEHEVAIKLLRSGMDSKDLLSIFEKERNVLARLKHPNIAQIYDAGLTEKGSPFFVMEYVDGEELLSHLERQRPSLSQKLALFIQVCEAVHVAHQNTIIHRDIKPSNIFVNKQGAVKLMDFGIAEIVEEGQSENRKFSPRLLTPEYASPEQKDGDALDVRSDVYQLGRILEKMAGSGRDRELDSIQVKATNHDREARYQSVTQLVRDIRNKLEKRPIEVYSTRLAYKTKLYAQRNFWQVGVSTAAILILLITSIAYFIKINEARKEAEQKEDMANQALEFLVALFDQSDPTINQGDSTSIGTFLSAGQGKVDLLDNTQTKAAIINALGRVNTSLGNFGKADGLYQQASSIYEHLEDAAGIGTVRFNQGILQTRQNNFSEARGFMLKALPKLESDLDRVKALVQLADLYRSTHLDSALTFKTTALEIIKSSARLSAKEKLVNTYDLAWIGYAGLSKEKKDSVVLMKRKLVDELKAVDASDLATLATMYENLANTYENALVYDSTVAFARQSLKLFQRMYDSTSIFLTPSLYQLASAFSWKADFDSSLHYLKKSLRIKQNYFGALHHSQLKERKLMAIVLANLGQHDASEQLMRTNYEISKKKYGLYHKITGDNLFVLLSRLGGRKKYEESAALYPVLLKIDSATYGESSFSAASILNYGQVLSKIGRKEEAILKMKEALNIYREKVGPDDFRCGMALFSIGDAMRREQPEKALAHMDSAVAIIQSGMSENHPRIATYQRQYAALLAQQKHFLMSNEYYLKAIRNYEINYGDKRQDRLAELQEAYSGSLRKQGLMDSASHLMERARRNYKLAENDD